MDCQARVSFPGRLNSSHFYQRLGRYDKFCVVFKLKLKSKKFGPNLFAWESLLDRCDKFCVVFKLKLKS